MTKLQTAINAVMKDVDYVKKDGRNVQQGFAFASVEAIVSDVHAAAVKHGLTILPSYDEITDLPTGQTKNGGLVYRVRVRLILRLGYGDESQPLSFYGEGADSGDKAVPKAQTMALKQALRQVFLIEVGEHDADNKSNDEHIDVLSTLPDAIKKALAKHCRSKLNGGSADEVKAMAAKIVSDNQGDLVAIESFLSEQGAM